MTDGPPDRLELAKSLEQSAARNLKDSRCEEAILNARHARSLLRFGGSVDPARRTLTVAEREIAVASFITEATALAYRDKHLRGFGVAAVAVELAKSPDLSPRFYVDAILTGLYLGEIRRDLGTKKKLWRLGMELQSTGDSREKALRAFGRFIACCVWGDDLDHARAATAEGDRLLAEVDDPDAIGSYLIWTAQALMREDRFKHADKDLHEALELREDTQRRAMTDLYAGAFFELKRGDKDAGWELAQQFLRETLDAGLHQYHRVGFETLSPLLP